MSDHKKDRERKLLKRHALETQDEDESTGGIDVSILERRLEGLRDTQESVQGLSLWCQTNKRQSSIILDTWLRILRKSPVEKRLTLFYLANDVIQHAKKKNDLTVVNQWAFAIQKATPHVRTPSSVSAAISRIFKIWEERGIYSKDAIADLLALLNNIPARDRIAESNKPETYTASAEKVSAFQPSSLISKVKQAYRLKSHLGVTFNSKKYVDMDMDGFRGLIRDRTQGLEVVHEIQQYLEQLKASEIKLSGEVEERRKIVETSEIALVFYENVRGEAKIVNAAYKNFTDRVMSTNEKVDEKIKAFDEMEGTISPMPSPPAAAPSPPPDEEEFGVRPANKCGGTYSSTIPAAAASYIEVIQQNTSNTNTNEIPIESTSAANSESLSNTSTSYTPPATGMNSHSHPLTVNPPAVSPYDPSQSNAYQAITSIQQQIQQAWSTSGMADSYATMSMSLSGLNFMQNMQQSSMPIMSTGYGAPMQSQLQSPYGNMNMGYETYQPQANHHQQHSTPPLPPPTDLSTIPLPPGPNPPQPPPPLPQEAPPDQLNPYAPITNQPPPPLPPANPFEAEYDPMAYSHNSSFSEPGGYDPSSNTYNNNSHDSSPIPISPQSRYHPYNNHSPRGRRLSGPHHSMGNSNNLANANRYPSNETSPTGSQILSMPDLSPMTPMEIFSQSLNKNRGTGANDSSLVPESPVSAAGDWSALKENASQNSFMQSQNPYYMNNSFSDFDNGQGRPEDLNGSDMGSNSSDPYIPQQQPTNNIFDMSPQPVQHNRGINRGMHQNHRGGGGGPRGGMKHHMNSRGHPRGTGGNRGFSGGFRGMRGAATGMSRAGPPHARGRGRF